MNKIKSLLLAVIGLLCSISVSAEDFEVDGIYYNITSESDKTVEVTFRGAHRYSYSYEYSGAVTIPESVTYSGSTYSVTSIGEEAFYECGLTSVEIPNSVTSIGSSAFYDCFRLTSVEIPNSVTSIGGNVFSSCSGLTSLVVAPDNPIYDSREGCNAIVKTSSNELLSGCQFTIIPNSVTSIGDYAFCGCSGLTSVEIPNSVTSIGDYAFSSCSNLTSVEIPNSVTSIGRSAFNGCSSLTSIEIPNSVSVIDVFAFAQCTSLTSVKIPNGVTHIQASAFAECTSLTSVELPNDLLFFGWWAFAYCTSLTSVKIPNSVTRIEESTFNGCSSLTSIEIPNSVTNIERNAFYNCSSLTSVNIEDVASWCNIDFGGYSANPLYYAKNLYLNGEKVTELVIPNSVTSIGDYAFYNCSGLTFVEIPNSVTSIEDYAFSSCSNLTSVEIPNTVTNIGSGAFFNCFVLTSVEIPNSVTSIGNNAFYNCGNLISITSLNPTPPTLSSSTFNMYGATLYVPFGTKTAYSEAEYWKNFTNIEELAPSIYELTDGEEYNEASDMTVEALTYTRTLPNLHWNALYVPFELPYDVIADRYDVAYINDVNGYDTDENGEIDDLAMEIIRIKGGTLKANYPYLIKAKTEADKAVSITVEDATLYAAEENAVDCSSVYQSYVVKGTYTKKTAEELAGKLAISTSGAWQPLAEGTALNPFRLYLSIENRDNSPLKVESAAMSHMRIVERGETTGIEEVVPSLQREDVIFDLSGRRVKQPVKGGVYIVNGKKRIL